MTVSNESLLGGVTSKKDTGRMSMSLSTKVSTARGASSSLSTSAEAAAPTAHNTTTTSSSVVNTTSIRVMDHDSYCTTICPTINFIDDMLCGRNVDDRIGEPPPPPPSIMMNPTSLIQKRHNDARFNPSFSMDKKRTSSSSSLLYSNMRTDRVSSTIDTEQSLAAGMTTNLKVNHADGTIIIYSSSGGGSYQGDHHGDQNSTPPLQPTNHLMRNNNNDFYYYYTEVPFVSVHGMQTRRKGGGQRQDETGLLDDTYHCMETCQGGYHTDKDGHNSNSSSNNNNNNNGSSSSVEDLHHQHHKTSKGSDKSIVTVYLTVATIANAIPQFLIGYNLSVLNTPEKYIFPGHTTLAWSFTVSSLAIGAPLGAYIGGGIADIHGRRWALGVNGIGFFVAGLLQTFAPTLPVLTIARFVVGLMCGIASVLVPIYLGELAPPHLRGTIGTINQFATVVGIFVADLLSIQFASVERWRILLAVTSGLAVVQVLLMPWVVESPLFLLRTNPHNVRAREILQQLRGYASRDNLEAEVEVYLQHADESDQESIPNKYKNDAGNISRGHHHHDHSASPEDDVIINKNGNNNNINNNTDTAWRELMNSDYLRFLFLCSILLNLAEELCGVNAVFYYSTSVFEDIINKPLIGTTSTGAVNVIFTYVALLLMDRCERKSLVLWSIGGMFIACLLLIGTQIGVWTDTYGIATLASVNAYVAFYAVGIGPIPVLWITEMVPPKYVSLTMSVCSQLNWMANFLVGLAFPSMREQLMGWTFVPFAVVLLVAFLFVWRVLPQKGESVAVTDNRGGDINMWQLHHSSTPNNGSRDGLMKTTMSVTQSGPGNICESKESCSQQSHQWEESAWA